MLDKRLHSAKACPARNRRRQRIGKAAADSCVHVRTRRIPACRPSKGGIEIPRPEQGSQDERDRRYADRRPAAPVHPSWRRSCRRLPVVRQATIRPAKLVVQLRAKTYLLRFGLPPSNPLLSDPSAIEPSWCQIPTGHRQFASKAFPGKRLVPAAQENSIEAWRRE